MIEAGAVILPGDGRGQLDKLGLVELLAQSIKERAGYLDRRLCHVVGELEHQLLSLGKDCTGSVIA